jgi:hypothetical protein
VESFVLTDQDTIVLGAQLPTDFSVTYHLSQEEADAGTGDLVSPYTNTSNPQTIFIRVEDDDSSSCFSTVSFDLVVNSLPEIIPIPDFENCDDALDGVVLMALCLLI